MEDQSRAIQRGLESARNGSAGAALAEALLSRRRRPRPERAGRGSPDAGPVEAVREEMVSPVERRAATAARQSRSRFLAWRAALRLSAPLPAQLCRSRPPRRALL